MGASIPIVDFYCGEGGAAAGMIALGCNVTGIDHKNHSRRYPGTFICANALDLLASDKFLAGFEFIWASPPCQVHTKLSSLYRGDESYDARHIDLIPATRQLLDASGKPYIIENVVDRVLRDPVRLCGCQFPELRVYRPRFFESNMELHTPEHFPHDDSTPPAGRGMSPKGLYRGIGGWGLWPRRNPRLCQ
jgi:DNA (cytosine-5)-methyltransferase 1